MSVTETGRGSKLVFFVNEEMASFWSITFLSFYILFATTFARILVAIWSVIYTAFWQTVTGLTSIFIEIPIVGFAFVTLISCDSRFTCADAIGTTLR